MRRFALILAPVLLAGCGTSSYSGPTTDGFRPPVLTVAGFTGSVVEPQKRFAGYARNAQRVTLVDPATEAEAWGRQVDTAADVVVPLPDYSGVAVLTGATLQLLGPGVERTFPAPPFTSGRLAHAADAAAYAVVADDGSTVRIERLLTGGGTDEQTLTPPAVGGGTEGGASALASGAASDQPPGTVALWSADGTRLVLFRPDDGAYATYSAADAASPLTGPSATCAGNGSSSVSTYRTLAYDDASHLVFAGDKAGTLTVFDPTAACVAAASRPKLTLGDGAPLTDVTVTAPGQLLVTQAGGRLHRVAVTGKTFGKPTSWSGVCPYPLGSVALDADRVGVVCYTPVGFDPVGDAKDAPAVITYSDASLQVVPVATGEPSLTIPLPLATAAGLVLDAGKLLILDDSAVGALEIVDLGDGTRTEKQGLFLGGLLH